MYKRQIPPGGMTVRALEEKREEEEAYEQSQAFSTYRPDERFGIAPYLYGLIVLAAFGGAAARTGSRRRRDRAYAVVGGQERRDIDHRRPRRRL